jgi:hypothetical protein
MGYDFKIELDISELKAKSSAFQKKQIDQMLQQTFNEVMGDVFAESQSLVPVKTGALRNSGKIVSKNGFDATGAPEVSITYGDDVVDYAVYVHEDLEKFHADPTQAKFLETALLHHKKRLTNLVRTRLQKIMS